MSPTVLFIFALLIGTEAAQPMLTPLFRSTGLSRTTRIKYEPDAPAFDKGWADEVYTCLLGLGTPANWRNFTIDFGWGPTFMNGDDSFQMSKIPNRIKKGVHCADPSPRGEFGPKMSKTFVSTGLNYGFTLESPFTSDCGKFPIAGEIIEDTVQIGTERIPEIPMVLMPKDVVGQILHPGWYSDGILGLGYWSGFFGDGTFSFILKLLESFPKKLVTIFIDNADSALDTTTKAGAITYGDTDHKNCRSDQWRQVTASWTYGWSILIDRFKFGKYTSPNRAGVGVLASPTAYMFAPAAIRSMIVNRTEAVYDKVTDQYYLPCSRRATQPPMIFNLQGYEYRLGPEHYIRKIAGLGNRNGDCILMIGESSREDTWFLGTAFHRSNCMMFDFTEGNMKLWFAPPK